MIPQLLHTLRRARKGALQITAVLGLAGLAAVSSSRASVVSVEPSVVTPTNDTFSFRVVGYNTSFPAQNIYLTQPVDFAFSTTASYPGFALNNQSLTVSSTQYLSGNNVVDFFSFSVPSNFVPAGTTDNGGHTLNAIQFSIGNYLGGNNPLNLSPAISNATVTGTVTFVFNGATTSGAVPMTTTLDNGGTALSTFGAVFATPSTADISNNQITAFSITVTYAVPEPSTYAMLALGTAGLFMVVVRRRRRRV